MRYHVWSIYCRVMFYDLTPGSDDWWLWFKGIWFDEFPNDFKRNYKQYAELSLPPLEQPY